MPILNLSGIVTGDNLKISVSQGAFTAGPYNIGSWGGGGKIKVNAIQRSLRQIAPDSVRFEVDLSTSDFDTRGPMGDEVYDARLHDLIYLWDLGDPGTWTEPVNVLSTWKNRNFAKGPSVSHVYRKSGKYTASVLVIEPSSGKTAKAETTVEVTDPQDFYGDANTIYVNNVGDSDFSEVPAGVPSSNKINIDSLTQISNSGTFTPDATWSQFKGTARRWRFKRGGSWEISIYVHFDDGIDMMFDDYGNPADPKPIWNTISDPEINERVMLQFGYAHDITGDPARDGSLVPPEFRVRNIDARGQFDARTTYFESLSNDFESFLVGTGAHDVVVVDCKMDGFGASNIVMATSVNASLSHIGRLHLDNCAITNFGGQYPIIVSNGAREGNSVSFTGVRWEQPGDAVSEGFDAGHTTYRMGSRSPARIGTAPFIHIRGCDIFHLDAALTCFQILKTAQVDGCLVNIHSCGAEGGSAFLDTDGRYDNTPQSRSHVHNMIVDGVIYVGLWNTNTAFSLRNTGVTVRNTLVIIPAVEKLGNSVTSFANIIESNTSGNALPDFVAQSPIKIYNCTFRVERTALQNAPSGSFAPDFLEGSYPNLTAVSETNNVFHMPNLSISGSPKAPNTTFAPLSENILWTPRCLGRRDPWTSKLDTARATPVSAIMDTKPLTGSAALGAALTGDVSYMDITLQKRPEPPSMGAWEAD